MAQGTYAAHPLPFRGRCGSVWRRDHGCVDDYRWRAHPLTLSCLVWTVSKRRPHSWRAH